MNAIVIENDAKATLVPQSETSAIIHVIERAARDPSIDIDKLQRLLDLRTQIEAKEAETAFDVALVEAQSEMEPVARDSANPQTRSRYASYTALDQALRPIYTKHGFSLSFNTSPDAPELHVRVMCRVSKGGYSRTYQIDMPADGKGAKGNDVMTKTHATGSAVSYGMRYLLKMIFNVTFGEFNDDDGNAAGKRAGDTRPPVSEASPVKPAAAKPPPAHDPVTGETGPRELPLSTADKSGYLDWARQYLAAITACKTLIECDQWSQANYQTLAKIRDVSPKLKGHIDTNIGAAREKLMKAQGRPKPVAAPGEPEAYLAHIADTLYACQTRVEVLTVWKEDFEPKLADMFPPDAAIARETLEKVLGGLVEGEPAS